VVGPAQGPAGGTRAPLRVAVVVESPVVPEWVAWTVARIAAAEHVDLAAIVSPSSLEMAGGARPPRGPLVSLLYERLDARVFGDASAMRRTRLEALGIAVGRQPPSAPIDVVIAFPAADPSAWQGPPPRHGVWTVAPADDGRPGAAMRRLCDVRGRVAGATAVLADSGGSRRVVSTGHVSTDHLSVTRTRDAAAWASARLLLRSLEMIHRCGRVPACDDGRPEEAGDPSAAAVIAHAVRTAGRGLAAKARSVQAREEWFVAVRKRPADGGARASWQRLANPPGRYLADPFPIEVDGRHYLFVEDYSVADGRGIISVLEATADGGWSPPRPVLQRDHHLSYPCVFRLEGRTYMLPETGEAGRVELYRAVELPHSWALDRVLLEGLTAVDATLHAADGLLWLFANVVDGPYDRGELRLYWSRSLAGPWRAHPENPVVTDPATARPAGRLFRRRGALIRPGQDCSRRYGGGIVLNRVEALSQTEYRERPVGRIDADWMPGLSGTHTYTFDSRYECLDAICAVPRLRLRGG
jgi:hypothetical protein